MPTPIRRITAAQFGLLAQPAQLTRKIAAVHVHHTWRPRRQDFRGLKVALILTAEERWPSLSHARLLVREYEWAAPFVSLFTVTGH